MADPLEVELVQVGPAAFAATAGSGGEVTVDGSPDIGGEGRGMRPMELLLTSLASCAAMDVVHILRKQRQPLEGLSIAVEGKRVDAVPARFEAIHLRFIARGDVAANKLDRAVRLGVEKYCSVGASLAPDLVVTWEATRGVDDG
ncbi:MAG: OsmC family protein [Polyangiaceae bacterium]